jgi:hypothetical protein
MNQHNSRKYIDRYFQAIDKQVISIPGSCSGRIKIGLMDSNFIVLTQSEKRISIFASCGQEL